MHAMLLELKQAARGMTNQAGFSLLVIGVLAAGLGCVIYMLIAIGSMVMRPLPFPDAERLMHVGVDSGNNRSGQLDPMRSNDLLQLRRQLTGIADVSGFEEATINLSDLDRPERFNGAFVSGNLFRVLGVAPIMGRDFTLADEREGAPPVVMLSHDLWDSRYGSDPGVIGRQVRVNSQTATIVGVMPADFSYPRREVIWAPGTFTDGVNSDLRYGIVIRRAVGASSTAIETAVASWFADAKRNEPEQFREVRIGVESLALLAVHAGTRSLLGVMLVSAMLVLLIACANTTNLLLTRTLARRQELAIRVALGADRMRLAVHLIAQSLILTLIAAGVGLLCARIAAGWTDAAFRASPDGPPYWIHFALDSNVIVLTLVVALVTALVSGLLPALRAGSGAMAGDLRDGTRGAGGGMARVSRVLMVGEVAMSLTLLIAVGTLIRGVMTLERSDLGIDPDGILTARVGLFESAFPTGAAQVALFDRITDRLRGDPAVIDATAGTNLPGLDGGPRQFIADGEVPAGDTPLPRANYAAVDDHFFSLYGLRMIEGRFFDTRDTATATPVAVVDQRFADRYGKEGSVVGRRFKLDPRDADGPVVTIVGVIPALWLDQPGDPIRPTLLAPLRQQPARFVSLAMRVKGDPAAFAPRLVETIRAVDPDTPAYWVRTYAQAISEATFGQRTLAKMFGTFGLVALVLAGAGLYGVIAFNVGNRTREIGVRRALGAPSISVLRDVLTRATWQVGLGLVIGLGLGLSLARILESALHGVPGSVVGGGNVMTAIAALSVLIFAAAIAAVVPTRRALRIDPMIALRHE
ncbi:MAG: ADOP family duplicated permease [Dokdonella sp.]